MFNTEFKKTNTLKNRSLSENTAVRKADIDISKWVKCERCKEILHKETLHENNSICPNCDYHFRLSARRRIAQIVDVGTFEELNNNMESVNPLDYPDYEKKIKALKEKTNINEAIKTGIGKINNIEVAIGVMDSNFLMGSMGSVVGEKITILIEEAIKKNLPVIIFTTSGGARMQEGMLSLMQMAKTSAAISKLNANGNLYITVLTDPTTGGVTASFASLGDIILAEPESLIGFAGPRVIEQTIKQKLPEGFQKSEFLLEHGFIDKIVHRKEMKETLYKILKLHCKN